MLLADLNFSNEAIGVIAAVVLALVGAIKLMWNQLRDGNEARLTDQRALWEARLGEQKAQYEARIKDYRLQEIDNQRKSYKEMTEEALSMAEMGGRPVRRIAKVVAESNSPATEDQKETAALSSARARVTAIALARGLEPRKEGDTLEDLAARMPTLNIPASVSGEQVEKLQKEITEAPDKIVDKVISKLAEAESVTGKREVVIERVMALVESEWGGNYRLAFDRCDSDHDGKISREELTNNILIPAGIGTRATRWIWEKGILKELDTDEDGAIWWTEFEAVFDKPKNGE